MNRKAVKLAAMCLTGTVIFGSQALTANASGLSGKVLSAGIESVMDDLYSVEEDVSIVEYLAASVQAEYEDIAIANVEEYVNIRKEASENSEAVGKLYAESAATVLEENGEWLKIESGSVTGYIKQEYLVTGSEAIELAEEVKKTVATVQTQTLNVRTEDSTEAGVVTLVPNGAELEVKEETESGWYKVNVDGKEGYVSPEFVETSIKFNEAVSKEEEAKQAGSDASATGSGGAAVAAFAKQFTGNPYVWGGSSLTNGADCSGFIMAVYRNFGVSLPHSSSALRSVGRGVSYSEAQPGDIICYSGHVALYIGGGQIVHASSAKTGIKISGATYKSILAVRRIF